jgi:uroporphyrinogen-III synthase
MDAICELVLISDASTSCHSSWILMTSGFSCRTLFSAAVSSDSSLAIVAACCAGSSFASCFFLFENSFMSSSLA